FGASLRPVLMRITGLAIVPPPTAADLPKVTPELLASVLARYSRSNDGLHAILEKVDIANPDQSIDRILKFVDYGHASIGGLTGGLAVTLDGVSMWLATKMFEIAQMADGQESSTRYITLDAEQLPDWQQYGLPEDLQEEWRGIWQGWWGGYQEERAGLGELGAREPGLWGKGDEVSEAVFKRLKKNYALDRARYFIPFATTTNIALVMTARMWAETIRHLAS